MALLDFLKKKERELPLPPPPLPRVAQRPVSDFEPIRAAPLRDWGETQQVQTEEAMPAPLPPLPPMPKMDFQMEEEHHDEVPLLPAPAMEKEDMFEKKVVFDRTIADVHDEELKKAPRVQVREPVERKVPAKTFVSVDDYRRIMSETNMVRQRLLNADNFMKKLQDLKVDEEKALERWRSQLEDVEKKLAYVDQLIEKSQR